MDIEDRWLTSIEAAEYLGYKPYTLRRARADKMLSGKHEPKYSKSGKAVRYRKADLDEWMTAE